MSYNMTCSLSKQTIAPGDKCYLLAIVRETTCSPAKLMSRGKEIGKFYGFSHSTCYPNDIWEPRGGMISATYDDRNRFVVDETAENVELIAHILKEAFDNDLVVAQGENASHDVPFDIRGYLLDNAPALHEALNVRGSAKVGIEHARAVLDAFDYVWRVMDEHRWFMSMRGVPSPAIVTSFHQSAAQYLSALAERRVNYHGVQATRRNFFDRALATASANSLKDIESAGGGYTPASIELISCLIRRLEDGAEDPKQIVIDESDRDLMLAHLMFSGSFSMHFRDALRGVGDSSGESYPIYSTLDRGLRELVYGRISREQLFEHLQPYFDYLTLTAGMEMVGLRFEPSVYCVSDYDNEVGKEYAKYVQEVSKAVTNEQKLRHSAFYGDEETDPIQSRPKC